jgi:hypothetical protein
MFAALFGPIPLTMRLVSYYDEMAARLSRIGRNTRYEGHADGSGQDD